MSNIESGIPCQVVAIEFTRWQKVRHWFLCQINRFKPREKGRLERHAEYELRRAGLFDKDSDYGGMVAEAVMDLIRVHAEEGHSGMSHALTLQIFNRVANYKTLTSITDDPSEWMQIDKSMMPEGEKTVWQNRRESSCFSNDGGKTYYSVDDEKRAVKTAEQAK